MPDKNNNSDQPRAAKAGARKVAKQTISAKRNRKGGSTTGKKTAAKKTAAKKTTAKKTTAKKTAAKKTTAKKTTAKKTTAKKTTAKKTATKKATAKKAAAKKTATKKTATKKATAKKATAKKAVEKRKSTSQGSPTGLGELQVAHQQLEVRERQQAAVAGLGQIALSSATPEPLFEAAVKVVAQTLHVDFAAVQALTSDRKSLRLVAGIGWSSDLVGTAMVGIGPTSLAGYTLLAEGPVLVPDLAQDDRFQAPPFLLDHGVVSGVTAPIIPHDQPWGVFGVHSRSPRHFTVDDVNFLRAVVHVLGETVARREFQEQLREREQRLRLVTDALPVLIAYCDRDLIYRFCNAAYQEWFNLKKEDIIGSSLRDVIGEKAFRRVLPQVRRALAGERLSYEQRLLYRHGPPRHVRIDYVPDQAEDGKVRGYYAMVRDVSARVATEQARARLAAIVEHSHDAIIGKDLDGNIISWNAAAERMYGYTEAEIMGKHVNILAPAHRQGEMRMIQEQIRKGLAIEQIDTVRRRKDGSLIQVLVTVSPIPDAAGNIVGASSIAHDVTRRKLYETALRESEQRLTMAKEAASLGIFDWNIEGNQLRWDERVRGIWGLDPEETVTLDLFLAGLAPEDRVATQAAIKQALDPDGNRKYYCEYRVINRNTGNCCWVAASGTVTFEKGRAARMVGTVQDITARRQTELELEQWADRLEERVAERTALAEQRAAELRDLATQITDAEQSARKHLAKFIHDDLQQLLVAAKMRLPAKDELATTAQLESVSALLDEALRKSRSLVSELSPPVLQAGTLKDAFEWLGRQMEQNHKLLVHLTADGALGDVEEQDKTALFNATRELLFNVVKHAQVDHAHLHITHAHDTIRIRVEDSGKGFDPNLARQHVDRFGLFSVRERMEAMGGNLDIDSAPGQGARFELILPLAPRREALHRMDRSRKTRKVRVPDGSGCLRIIIADDHKLMREGLARILTSEPGFEVVGEAANGQQAIRMAEELSPDLIVMDISMPHLNGIEATRQIVARQPDTVVIGLSLHDEKDLGEAIKQAGADVFLQKDVASTALIDTIRTLCEPVNEAALLPDPQDRNRLFNQP